MTNHRESGYLCLVLKTCLLADSVVVMFFWCLAVFTLFNTVDLVSVEPQSFRDEIELVFYMHESEVFL